MPGVDRGLLKTIVRDIGEVAFDPSVWPSLLHRISEATGSAGALLLQSDNRTPDIPRSVAVNELTNSYFRNNWHLSDLRAIRGVPKLIGGEGVITDEDVISIEEMRTDPFYNEHFRPHGFHWFGAIGFRAGDQLWGLSIQRTSKEGPFLSYDKKRLAMLCGFLSEAASLSLEIGKCSLNAAAQLIDQVGRGAIAIDRNGKVISHNAAAESIFDAEVFVKSNRLFLANLRARNELDLLLDKLKTNPSNDSSTVRPIVVRRTTKAPLLIRPLSIPSVAASPFLGARALLTLQTIEAKREAPAIEVFMNSFGLSRAEAKLTACLVCGRSLENSAIQLGISVVTARNQLKSVFAKTRVHRQSELMALFSHLV